MRIIGVKGIFPNVVDIANVERIYNNAKSELIRKLIENEDLRYDTFTFDGGRKRFELKYFILEPNEMEEYLKWKSQQRGK